jgi:hypothetical protein
MSSFKFHHNFQNYSNIFDVEDEIDEEDIDSYEEDE